MTIKRVNLSFYMGYGYPSYDFEDAIAKEACSLTGGCTVSQQTGYWIKGAALPQFRYTGEIKDEYCLKLELLVFAHNEDFAYEFMRRAIAQVARKYIPEMQWVHVTRCPVDALHFDVREVRL